MTDTTQTAPGAAPEVTNPTPTTANPIVPALLPAQEVNIGALPTPTMPTPGAAQEVTGQPGTMVDTSEYDSVSVYEPQLKKGRHVKLCKILAMTPGVSRDDNSFYGWTFSLALAEDAVDEFGGVLPAGTRLPMMSVYTTRGKFDADGHAALNRAVNTLLALNNISRNSQNKASCDAAKAAFMALPATRRLPHSVDTDLSHYEQWNGTYVKAVIKLTGDDEGKAKYRLLELQAKDTPVK